MIRHFTQDSPNRNYNLSILLNFGPFVQLRPGRAGAD
jgi:hypothetical protein